MKECNKNCINYECIRYDRIYDMNCSGWNCPGLNPCFCPNKKVYEKPRKIYLVIPYSNVDKEESFKIANKVAAKLMRDGYIVFSAISHGHPISQNNVPSDWEYWQYSCKSFIQDWCDEIFVVMMRGYKDSTGVNDEIRIGIKADKPIVYVAIDGSICPF